MNKVLVLGANGMLGKMCSLLEPDSVGKTSLSALIGRGTQADANYNDWMVGTRMLIIDEAKDTMTRDDFYKGYDTFKQNVDLRPTPVRINEKYGKTRDDVRGRARLARLAHLPVQSKSKR